MSQCKAVSRWEGIKVGELATPIDVSDLVGCKEVVDVIQEGEAGLGEAHAGDCPADLGGVVRVLVQKASRNGDEFLRL